MTLRRSVMILASNLLFILSASGDTETPHTWLEPRHEPREIGGEQPGPTTFRVFAPAVALRHEPVMITIEVVDADGQAVPAAEGIRARVSVGGSAYLLDRNAPLRLSSGLASAEVEVRSGHAGILLSSEAAGTVDVIVQDSREVGASATPAAATIRFLEPSEDHDHDGLSNLRELELGTDPSLADSDGDRILDNVDGCPTVFDPDQADRVHPGGKGDACDDPDRDGVADVRDSCPDLPDPARTRGGFRRLGEACALTPASLPAGLAVTSTLPFAATDVVFDPVRPYAYVSSKSEQKVYFVNLLSGAIEREFTLDWMTESLAITPDGSRLFVALLTREHSPYWFDPHEGYVASFDLDSQDIDREFHITEDPFDLVATSAGQLVVPSGSGQWTAIRAFDAETGAQTGSAFIRNMSRITLHPSEGRVYTANTDLSPSDIERFDLPPGGGIVARWDSPYHGDHRMDGDVWASPLGDLLVTRGGDAFTSGESQSTDMRYIAGLSVGSIANLAFDPARQVLFTLEGSDLHYYNLQSRLEIGSQDLGAAASFVGIHGDDLYAVVVESSATTILSLAHPAPGGATNTPPQAHFTVTPPAGQTTQMNLVFDASSSFDAEDPLAALQFRWDFDNDGSWDTSFSTDPTVVKRYPTAGTKYVRMQVRDSLALVADEVQGVNVAFEPDPGSPGDPHPPFELPFAVTDVVFDPLRPYMYVSRKADKKVYFVNLLSGFIEREFAFDWMTESLAITPDGSRLFVALLIQEHDYDAFGEHEGHIASFDLDSRVMDREFHITEDPFDLVATSDGHLVVPSGSGQWSSIKVFDAVTGTETGAAFIRHRSHITLHPSEGRVYTANTDLSPSDIERFDLLPGGGIVARWDSPYHGDHRMEGNVWASPLGDLLVTRGGDAFTSGESQSTDMRYISGLSPGSITNLEWDATRQVIFTLEAADLHYYNLRSRIEMGSQNLGATASFVGIHGDTVYALVIAGSTTTILSLAHPAPGGATNTPPQAHFTVTPPAGQTTQMNLVFDASSSFDAEDSLAALQFRWDFDNDGTWDTSFAADPTTVKRFPTAGTKYVRMQVRDSLALVADEVQAVNVAFEPDPGSPGDPHPPFELPFAVTDVVFDPLRPYMYVSRKADKKVYFVNLLSGFIEREFTFDWMTESLAITPDGSRLFVALLLHEHDSYDFGELEGYVASFDLDGQVMDRQFHITEDPFDLVATSDGHLVVPSGSGQWSSIKVFDSVTGTETGSAFIRHMSRITLHPSEGRVYTANTDLSPSDIERFDLLPGGGIVARWDSPYHGDHRMSGNVWASPLGDLLVTRGGDAYTSGEARSADMLYIAGLSLGPITNLEWDPTRQVIFTLEGSDLHYYNLRSRIEMGSQDLGATASYVGVHGDTVYALIVEGSTTRILSLAHPAPGGATNTPPQAHFTVTPPAGQTTQMNLVFDASSSFDAEDSLAALRFRWDFDNDGTWDTSFSADPTTVKRFPTAGTKYVRMQARDSLALVADELQTIDIAFEPDPGSSGEAHPPFELPFAVTDVVFDPVRPYMYVSRKADKKVYFVNLLSGFIEREFTFDWMTESLAITPDGSRLFVALLVQEHSYYWFDSREGYVASFDLDHQVMDREFHITEDPFDIVVTSDGHLVVPSGSGQWTYIKVYDALTGTETGSAGIRQMSRLTLHPSEGRVYAADTDSSPSDIERFDLLPGGGIAARWDSPYHGDHRMSGNVWASPLGDLLVTRGGDAYTSGASQSADMNYIAGLSVGTINALAWDSTHSEIITVEDSTVHRYSLGTRAPLRTYALPGPGSFVGIWDSVIYSARLVAATTSIDVVAFRPKASPAVAPVVECQSAGTASVLLDGSQSTDPNSTPGTHDDIARFEWFESFGLPAQRFLGEGETLSTILALGSHTIALRVTDRAGDSALAFTDVAVRDTTPPTVIASMTPNPLAQTHHMVDVHAAVVATDACGGVSMVLDWISSNENSARFFEGAVLETDDHDFRLLAERNETGVGRIYTVVYLVTDDAGNHAWVSTFAVVPHEQAQAAPDPISLRVLGPPSATLVSWSPAASARSYDVIRGRVGNIRDTGLLVDLGDVVCVERNTDATDTHGHADSGAPALGEVFFYLVQHDNGEARTYGASSSGRLRAPGPGACD